MSNLNLAVVETWESGKQYLQEHLNLWEFADTVQPQSVNWGNQFATLRDAIFQKQGAEVAEIGSTWLGSLVGMNALRPFSPAEVTRMGGANVFFPQVWESAFVLGDRSVWSIPWLCGARVIFYWRDMLEDAGVDLETAFQTPEWTEYTLERLQTSGIATPWAAPTEPNLDTLHHIASWIWEAGGDFLSSDGTTVMLTQRESLQGIHAYFRLHRFVPLSSSLPAGARLFELFVQREVAAIMTGPWDLNTFQQHDLDSAALSLVGVALPPGPPFVGGSNLVVLQHMPARYERTAIDLISQLVSPQVQLEYAQIMGLLPVRMDVLSELEQSGDPKMQMYLHALSSGRTIPNVPLWSVIEERMMDVFGQIWRDIQAQPEADLETIIADHLEPLVKRLNRMLAQ
jgi:multiple sugar transport system substrate-binding protein